GVALQDFDAALKLEPRHADALAGRGLALMMRGREADVGAATRAAEESLRSPEMATDREVGRYRVRAVALVRQALELVPEKERPAFWDRGVLTDPVLGPLQRLPAGRRLSAPP